jgi:ribosomal protein S18 acetylase RimI-like enzyme
VQLTVHPKLDDDSGQLWGLYRRAFDDLRGDAVQRHLMYEHEFAAVAADDRVAKYVVTDPVRDRVAALATMTNDLAAVPLISPDYFAKHWPELYQAGKIWYVSFVAVEPDYQGTGAMGLLIGRMCEEVGSDGGVICVDICEHNEIRHRLPTAIGQLANTYSPGVNRKRLDAQVFWAYEFPIPA